jgi:purine-nucleoside/S-methyl-5'-thioadenosine phosphorylase / adenosine deaminase
VAKIAPTWPCPARVRAFTTTREGGVSRGRYSSLNLGAHVGDEATAVMRNRRGLLATHKLPHVPRWLAQVHGARTVDAADLNAFTEVEADAVYTNGPDHICAVLTADCLPILLSDADGEEVAAVHAGWRGLLDGVVHSAVAKFAAPRPRIAAWIGPGIGVDAYVVDAEFRHRFLAQDPSLDGSFRTIDGHWHADLHAIAERRLRDSGIGRVSRYDGCTFTDAERFYSHRRDGVTGRMATLVWIDSGCPTV